MRLYFFLVLLAFLITVGSACVKPEPTATPTPTFTPMLTSTPTATATSPAPLCQPVILGTLAYPQRDWGQPVRYTPALGFYDSSNVEVLDQQIAWMKYAGIDFVLWQWIADQGFTSEIIDLYRARPDALPWAVHYESKFDLDPVGEWRPIDFTEQVSNDSRESRGDRFVRSMNDLIDKGLVSDENYLKVNGRPVIYLWAFSYWRNWAPYVDRVFVDYESRGLKPPFFIGEVNGWAGPYREPFGLDDAKDRIAAFFPPIMVNQDENMMSDYFGNVHEVWKRWKQAAKSAGSIFIPMVTPGFDYTSVNPDSPVLPRDDGATLRQHYGMAYDLRDTETPLLIIKSFNDFPEGDTIEPSEEYGMLYLDILRNLNVQCAR